MSKNYRLHCYGRQLKNVLGILFGVHQLTMLFYFFHKVIIYFILEGLAIHKLF